MSTVGQFNTKSPTIKRILREAAELSNSPSPDYHAAPLETNLFEWHFTLRGPPAPSPYATGLYHGRIVLPPTYPLRPPSFRFLTPSGRFEPNREICLSISGHHEESWQPAWGIRTALVAIRSFMDSEAKGQLGGIEAGAESRKRMAGESLAWKCSGCGGKTNKEIMKEQEEEAGKAEGAAVEEKVPEELKLGYRDELGKGKGVDTSSAPSAAADMDTKGSKTAVELEASEGSDNITTPADSITSKSTTIATQEPQAAAAAAAAAAATIAVPQQQSQSIQQQQQAVRQHTGTPQEASSWLDMAIIGIAVTLGIMILRKILSIT